MDTPNFQPPGQGSAGSTDLVTQLQGIVRQLSTGNANALKLIAAINSGFPKTLDGYTVATLPASPSVGQMAYVTDGTAGLSWGANVSGGHSTTYLVWWQGLNWTVVGI